MTKKLRKNGFWAYACPSVYLCVRAISVSIESLKPRRLKQQKQESSGEDLF